MPSTEVTFTLSNDDLSALRKAASTLGVSDVVVTGAEGASDAKIMVTDVNDSTANSFELELSNVTRPSDQFNFVFNIGNFKLISGDYDVAISSKLISHFKSQAADVEYWIALEKSSTFGG